MIDVCERIQCDAKDHASVENCRCGIMDAYEQGRADAIEEFKAEMSKMKRMAFNFLNSDYSTGYISAISTLEGYGVQIKEQKNE